MTSRERYDELVRRDVGEALRALGFRRARHRFERWRGAGWEIIDLQASDRGSRDRVRFTVNLATAVEGLPRRSAWDERRCPSEADAHLRERLGLLLEGRDVWWELDAGTDAGALAAELLAALHEHALRWLEARSSLDRVLALIASEPSALGWEDLRGLPLLLERAGDPAASAAVLAEAARREAAPA